MDEISCTKLYKDTAVGRRTVADTGIEPLCENIQSERHQLLGSHGAEKDIALHDSTWDEGVSEGRAAQKVQVVILGTGESWMQRAIAGMGDSFRGRAAGK